MGGLSLSSAPLKTPAQAIRVEPGWSPLFGYPSSLSGFARGCDGGAFGCSARRVDEAWAGPKQGGATTRSAEFTPARRVEAKRGVCGVAALDNGPAIGCALRLASIPVWLQRIPRAKPDRLLAFLA